MTISTTIIKNSYSGDGSTTVFPYTFKINAEADIQVIIRAANGTETVKTLTTDYTISGVGSASGGNVTMVTAPSATETLVIRRETIQTQTVDLVENDPFTAETVEGAFDKSIAVSQELQEEVDRSIKLSRTNTMTSTEFTVDAATRANKILAFDSAGEISVTQELGTYQGNWAASTSYNERDLVKDTSNNNVYLCNTAHTSSGSQPISSNTDVAKWDLIVDAASATSSASAAATSATNAANSATAAATSASNASTSESNAATSASTATTQATNASNSATAAQTAQAAAEAALDNFDDRFLGAKATDPTLDNDGNALQDGALYFDTTNDIMKVYDLTNTTWRQLTLTSANQAYVNTVAGQISPTNNIATLAGLNTEITNLGGLTTEITNLNNIRTDISSVNSISTEVQGVYNNTSNINAVYNNATNINTVAGLNSEISLIGTSANIASITTAANNLADINAFANIYLGPSATAPTQDPDGSALDVGDLYFDSTSNAMKVYGSSGWQNAGSSVNGTSQRYNYTATSGQTTFTGADNNGNTLTYDAGYIDVYLNGVKLLNGTDVTVTSGSSVVLASGATTGDVVDIVAYGTFSVATLDASNLTSGTVPDARITGAYTGITNLTMSGDLTVDTNTLYVDSTNNRVGIGTSSPAYPLDIHGQTGSLTRLRVQNDGTAGSDSSVLQLGIAGTTAESLIYFGDSGDNNAGQLRYDHASDYLSTHTAGSERMRIDSSGNLLVGKSSLDYTTVGTIIRSDGSLFSTTNDANTAVFERLTSDGDIIRLEKNNSTNGRIGIKDTGIYIGDSDSAIYMDGADNAVLPFDTNTLAENDAFVSIGNSAYRFKDLYLSGGLYVGGTGSANKLDDYEEGTFTAEFSSSGATFTYSVRQGYYTKIGNRVIYNIYIQLDGTPFTTTTSNTSITGLPFTSTNASAHTSSSIASVRYVNFDSGYYQLEGRIGRNTTSIDLLENGDNVPADALRSNQLSNLSGQVFLSGSYQTDA